MCVQECDVFCGRYPGSAGVLDGDRRGRPECGACVDHHHGSRYVLSASPLTTEYGIQKTLFIPLGKS